MESKGVDEDKDGDLCEYQMLMKFTVTAQQCTAGPEQARTGLGGPGQELHLSSPSS
jgi:hypothetical protein